MTLADDYINRVLDVMPRATPRREQIAAELRGHIAERVAHDHPIADILRQLGDPTVLAESYLSAIPLVSAPFWRRALAKLFDVMTFAVVCVPVALMTWGYVAYLWVGVSHDVLRWVAIGLFCAAVVFALFGLALMTSYPIIAEYWFGQTLGKRLLEVHVVRESGARISVGQAIVRQLPWFLQVFWIDAMFALFTEKNQRAFELLSKTRVVLAEDDGPAGDSTISR